MHFKCAWVNEFKDTKDEPFYLTPNNQVTVKMMSLKKTLNYYHDDNLKFGVLQLPYEVMLPNFYLIFSRIYNLFSYICIVFQGHAYSMIILLPDEKDGLKNLENNFSKIKLHELVEKTSKYEVNVKLPRFKIEQSLQLEEVLSNVSIY